MKQVPSPANGVQLKCVPPSTALIASSPRPAIPAAAADWTALAALTRSVASLAPPTNQIAIVLDGVVYSSPQVNGEIPRWPNIDESFDIVVRPS